jgi:hypothetical protein
MITGLQVRGLTNSDKYSIINPNDSPLCLYQHKESKTGRFDTEANSLNVIT